MTEPPQPEPKAPRRGRANHRRRRWLPYAGAVLLVGLIFAGLWPRPVPVETALAGVGALRATVNEEGKTRIKQRYVVSAPVTGQLRRISFKAGAEVVAGRTIVAVIDPVPSTLLDERTRIATEARRDAAAANVGKARANHDYASNELRRVEKLFAEKTVAVQEFEAAQMREAAAAKDLSAAEGTLRQVEAELAQFGISAQNSATNDCTPQEIKAPASGRVLRVFEENTRVVTVGTPLVEIGDPSDLEVVIEVLSRDGAIINAGDPIEFDQWGGGQPLTGRVRLVEPAAFTKISALGVEEQRVNVIADLTTPPEQRRNVGDAFRVEARIIVWQAPDALKVSTGALFRQGEQWAVFVLEEGRARLRIVQAGRSSGTETQIVGGLKSGDKVILYPGNRIHEGQRVKETKV